MVLDYRVNPRKLSAGFRSVDSLKHQSCTKTLVSRPAYKLQKFMDFLED